MSFHMSSVMDCKEFSYLTDKNLEALDLLVELGPVAVDVVTDMGDGDEAGEEGDSGEGRRRECHRLHLHRVGGCSAPSL